LNQQELRKPPQGLAKRGKRLWAAISLAMALDERDEALLFEAARVADRLDALAAVLRRVGVCGPDGRAQPALVEARQQQLTLARLIVAMRLPEDLSEPLSRRPQRRGIRGSYFPREGGQG
jgi:hypothetical protein